VSTVDLISAEDSSSKRYSLGNITIMVIFIITLVAFLNAAILALAWSNKPFLGFVIEPTLVVSDVSGAT
jgi:hypothetical protein